MIFLLSWINESITAKGGNWELYEQLLEKDNKKTSKLIRPTIERSYYYDIVSVLNNRKLYK